MCSTIRVVFSSPTFLKEIGISPGPPRPSSEKNKGNLFAPQGQRARNKSQTGDRGLGSRGRGQRLPLDRQETDAALRLMAAYKDKKGNPVLG